MDIPFNNRPYTYFKTIQHYLSLKNYPVCRDIFGKFEFADIPPYIYNTANDYIKATGKKIIGSFDASREPTDDEIIVVYGNYPDWHRALPCSHKMFRNVSFFGHLNHDAVEYHKCWEPLDIIYILNVESRTDRLNDVMNSLARVRAPLHRVKVIKAITESSISPHAACTESHVGIIKEFKDSGYERCLIIEDDIVFIDDVETVWQGLSSLFRSTFVYNVCFLALSKYGVRESLDDVFSITKQPCTTASAYVLNKQTIDTVYDTVNEGLSNIKKTSDFHTNCIDRYWSRLDNMVYLKTKIAFQRPGWSSTRNCVLFFLD